MSLEVSVDQVLGKIAHHNSDVLGCIAAHDDHIYSSLPEIYDLIDVDAIIEYAANMFAITEVLETGPEPFEEVFLEFQGHSFLVRKLELGTLILVTKPVQRGAFRKMQLGLNLFLKPLQRALEDAANGTDAPAPKQHRKSGPRGLRRVFGGLV